MNLLPFNRLSVRIIFFAVVLFTVTIGAYVTLFVRAELRQEREEIVSNGLVFSELSARVLFQDYLTASARGFPTFEELASEQLAKNEDVVRVMMVAVNGKIIFDSRDFGGGASTGRTGAGQDRFVDNQTVLARLANPKLNHEEVAVDGEEMVEIVVPIAEAGGGHLFAMRYWLSFGSLKARTILIYRDSLITFIPLFLLTIAAGVVLAISITRPIVRLSQATEKIRKGELKVQVPVISRDEIGNLTETFNLTVVALDEAQGKLREYSKNLEDTVAARTVELKDKVDELSRINRLMVDRELKMVELKKLISELEKKSGALHVGENTLT